MKKIILLIVFLVSIAISFTLHYITSSHDKLHNVDSDYKISSIELLNKFESDEVKSEKLYIDKIIEIEGCISDIEKNNSGGSVLVLSNDDDFNGICCSFEKEEIASISHFKIGDSITIKGECKGMMMDIILNRCVLAKAKD